MNKSLRLVALLLLLIHVSLLGGCNLKEAFCEFLGESCGDPRPSEDPDFNLDPRLDLPPAVKVEFSAPPPSVIVAGAPWPDVSVELLTFLGTRTQNPSSVGVALVHDGSGTLLGADELFTTTGELSFPGLTYTKAEMITVSIAATSYEGAPPIESPAPVGVIITPDLAAAVTMDGNLPETITAGSTWPDLSFHLVDQFGNQTGDNGVTLTVSIASGSDTLQGSTSLSTVNGAATFSGLSYDTAEDISISVTSSGIVTSPFDGSLEIAAAPIASVSFGVVPGLQSQVGVPISFFTVELRDALGNRATNSSPLQVAIAHNGSGMFLASSGSVDRTTDKGIVVFDDLSYDTAEVIDLTVTVSGWAPLLWNGLSFEAGPATGLPVREIELDAAAQMAGYAFNFSYASEYSISHDARFALLAVDSSAEGQLVLYDEQAGMASAVGRDVSGVLGISSDGRFVLRRFANPTGVEVYDRQNHSTIFASDESTNPWMTPSGRFLVHQLIADPDRVYITDLATGGREDMTVAADGGSPNDGDVRNFSVSDDGRHVLFISRARNLTENTLPVRTLFDFLFVRDRDVSGDGLFDEPGDARTVLMNVSSAGEISSHTVSTAAMSGDGRFVVFSTRSNNLVPGDSDFSNDVFLRNRDLSGNGMMDESGDVSTIAVSRNTGGELAIGPATSPAISTDGRYVSFTARSDNLDQRQAVVGWATLVHDRDVSGDGTYDEPADVATVLASLESDGYPFSTESAAWFAGDSRYLSWKNRIIPNPLYLSRNLVQLNDAGSIEILSEQTAPMGGNCDFGNAALYVQIFATSEGTVVSGVDFASENISDLLPAPSGLSLLEGVPVVITSSLSTFFYNEKIEQSNDPAAMWGADANLVLPRNAFRIGAGGVSYVRLGNYTGGYEFLVAPATDHVVNYEFIPPQESGGAFELTWTRRCLAP